MNNYMPAIMKKISFLRHSIETRMHETKRRGALTHGADSVNLSDSFALQTKAVPSMVVQKTAPQEPFDSKAAKKFGVVASVSLQQVMQPAVFLAQRGVSGEVIEAIKKRSVENEKAWVAVCIYWESLESLGCTSKALLQITKEGAEAVERLAEFGWILMSQGNPLNKIIKIAANSHGEFDSLVHGNLL